MLIASVGHVVFALALIGLGVVGLLHPEIVPLWSPVPGWVPAQAWVVSLGALISMVSGVGLLIRRTARSAARLLLATLFVWLVLFRLPNFFRAPLFEASWTMFPLAVIVAAAWVLYVWFAGNWDREHLRLLSGESGLRMGRALYGLSLIFFGLAHFIDQSDTVSLVPRWLPGHLFWALFTGGCFVAEGVALLAGIWPRLAAALSALQIGSFLLLVWIPIVARGSASRFQWSETTLNAVLWAGAWMVADSYRDRPWLAMRTAAVA